MLESGSNFADYLVSVEGHISEIGKRLTFPLCSFSTLGGIVRCFWKRRVNQYHGIVGKEWLVFVRLNEIDQEIRKNIGAVVGWFGF